MEMSGQLHSSAVYSLGKSPRYPLERRLGGPQSSLDAVEKRKILPLPGIEPLSSLSVYRLSYLGFGVHVPVVYSLIRYLS
jgi:hypothetical protein